MSALTGAVRGQTLADIGAANPTPGANDISQLSTNGNQHLTGAFNYYSNNANPPGQTFAIGATPMVLTSVSLKTGTSPLDSGSGGLGPQAYSLRIYSLSGSAATLVTNYTSPSSFSYVDGDWLQWGNLFVTLATNKTYAYTFRANTSGWDGLAVANGNPYGGGEAVLIPLAGGTVTFQSSHSFDATFDIGLSPAGAVVVGAPSVSPSSTVYLGSSVTLTSSSPVGTSPFFYQWQTDGGGGTITNIPNATNSSVSFTPASAGSFQFDVIVTNNFGGATSSVAVATVLPPVAVTVNASQPVVAMPDQGLGVASAVYDNILIDANVAPLLIAAGVSAVRYPGGSYADAFNWQTTTMNGGGYINSNDTFDNWMNTVVNPAGAKAIITVNYGSNPGNNGGGDPNVAAAWVNYANMVKGWGVKYWEIGNEQGGNGYYGTNLDWEYDLHFLDQTPANRVGQPALSPTAYGSNSLQFINAMKLVDPSIKCGIGFDTGRPSYNSAALGQCGSVVDFVIIHWYPGGGASGVLASTLQIASTASDAFTQLTNNVGAVHASQMKLAITETGPGGVIGAPASLFTADNYLTWIENGAVNVDYQELHNSFLASFMGGTTNDTPLGPWYGALMSHLTARPGDTLVATTSAQSLLRVHAATRLDGNVSVLLLNEDPTRTISTTVTIGGATLATFGTSYQFGLTNFVSSNAWPTYPVSTNTVSGSGTQFTVSVPPYTMIALIIPNLTLPTAPTGLAAVAGDQSAALKWNASAMAIAYNLKRALVSGGPYSIVAGGLTVTNFTDTGLTNGTTYYYVVSGTNNIGEGTNSAELAVTPSFNHLLTRGTIIGTSGSFGGLGHTKELAMDGDLATYFDGPGPDGNWVGLDFGSGTNCVITQVSYCPRSLWGSRMTGGVFQGAHLADFSDAVTWFTITDVPLDGTLTTQTISDPAGYEFVRYLGPSGSYGDVAEVQFTGHVVVPLIAPHVGVSLAGGQLQLSWPTDHLGWQVQAQTNGPGTGLSTNWVTLPGSGATNWFSVPVDNANGSVFFRLVSP